MESAESQTFENHKDERVESTKAKTKIEDMSTAIPFLITMIGIFCYLGVILPAVFGSSTRVFDYSTFDLLLMVGGAALMGLGTYFWFKIRAQVLAEEEKKALELA